eukprot:COSAG01_NODE_1522_length_10022_cov_81.163761_6_plen_75_part_00
MELHSSAEFCLLLARPAKANPRSRPPIKAADKSLGSPPPTCHFAFHRSAAGTIPTVILGGDGNIHFAFHPEKDG